MDKLNYIWASSKKEIIITVAVLVVAFTWVGFTNGEPFFLDDMGSWYSQWIDPAFSITTLVIAFSVWINSKNHDWERALPKKLDVHFIYNGGYILSCYHANLIGEHDIRALGQQIGAQMNGKNLDFFPMVSSSPPVIKKTGKGKYYQSYEIKFTLKELPSKFEKEYLVWLVDKEDVSKIKTDGLKEIKAHPDKPFHVNNPA